MARPGITYAHVAKAAAEMVEAGKSLTVDSVREALGDTGSKSTIGPLVKRWKVEHEAHGGTAASGLPAHLLEAVAALNERMQADADSRIETLTQAHEQAVQEIAGRLSQAEERAAGWVKERNALTGQVTEMRERNDALMRENQSLQLGTARATTEIAGLNDRLSDRAEEIKALQEQQTKARQQFEHYQQSVAAQRADERQQSAQQVALLEQELVATRKHFAAAQTQATRAETRLEESTEAHQQLRAEMTTLQQQHRELVIERPVLLQEISALTTRNTTVEAKLDTAQQAQTAAQTELAVVKHTLADAGNRLTGLEGRLVDVDAENRRLLQANASLQGQLDVHSARR